MSGSALEGGAIFEGEGQAAIFIRPAVLFGGGLPFLRDLGAVVEMENQNAAIRYVDSLDALGKDLIIRIFLDMEESEISKVFDNNEFAYWTVTVERPLRLRVFPDRAIPNSVFKKTDEFEMVRKAITSIPENTPLDTAVDSHIGTPSVEKTYDQIKETELVPFAAAIENGADMIMTAHITYPLIDEEVVFGDGETKGFYPATMSKKIITDILRGDLGYDGVVVTDALEMDAIRTAGLVPGDEDSTEYRANVAQKVIEAGIDLLLLPCDMNSADAVSFYDEYIGKLTAMVEDGTIPQERIDESVRRILKLKEKYGILDPEKYSADQGEAVEHAREVIGSDEHHEIEMEIAKQAVTLLKNEEQALPFTADNKKIVFLGRQAEDSYTISYALDQLKEQGLLDENVQVENLALGESASAEEADTKIVIDYYFDPSAEEDQLHYTEELQAAIREADVVVGFAKTYSLSALEETSAQYQGIARAIEDCHAAGGRFVFLSNNLPYDAARYQDADAILLVYMGSGLDMDPTARSEKGGNLGSYNANVVAAIHMMFGDGNPTGTLPVQIPEISTLEDGTLAYSDTVLYERGFGLTVDNA